MTDQQDVIDRLRVWLSECECELEEERELRQQYAEDAKRNLRDRDAAEASIAGLHDMREKLERELASANRHISQIQESWRDCIQRKGKAERELAEAREQLHTARVRLRQADEDAEAAEARLAAVAGALNPGTPKFAFQVVADVRAALSAPAEPKASTWYPDDASPSNPNLRGKP